MALRNVWRHSRRFGPVHGPRIWHRLRRRLPGDPPVWVRVPGLPHPISLRAGTADVDMFQQVFLQHEYDFPAGEAPSLIVDGGANIGMASLFFAVRYPQARIIAIEPEAANARLLRQNTALFPQIEVVQAALWSEPGELTLENPEASSSSFRVQAAGSAAPPGAAIRAVTLPELLAEAPPDARVLVKLDVEGAEKEIFSADTDWLQRVSILVVELHDRFKPGCGEALEAAVAPFPFTRLTCGENLVFTR